MIHPRSHEGLAPKEAPLKERLLGELEVAETSLRLLGERQPTLFDEDEDAMRYLTAVAKLHGRRELIQEILGINQE